MSNQVEVPELGAGGLARFAWRQLTSMRTALILLMMLGVAAIPGSLVPQRSQNPMAVRQYFIDDPQLARWIDRFSGFEVYSSPWFSAAKRSEELHAREILWSCRRHRAHRFEMLNRSG